MPADPYILALPQREEGRIQGQLNHSDSSQYIRELKDQIEELKAEVSPGGARETRVSLAGDRPGVSARGAGEKGAQHHVSPHLQRAGSTPGAATEGPTAL